jgi:superfamily II DNA or RNA helicase/HKD family nuclease
MAGGARGLYEVLVTEALSTRLRDLDGTLEPRTDELRPAEAADRIALHVGQIVRRALGSVPEKERAAVGIELARQLVAAVQGALADSDVAPDSPVAPAAVLRALLARRPDGSAEHIAAPLIPLLDTALLTNAPGEPTLSSQLAAEIRSADRIDLVIAFVRWSGIKHMMAALAEHADAGRPLRLLTTTYTGSTEGRALDALREAGASVRVSYDISSTRLHAKAWLFHRASGFSTAYIGSSNLTHSAQVTGLEWNVRVSGARNPDVIDKVAAVFEAYWQGGDFVPYDPAEFAARSATTAIAPEILLSPLEIRLEPFQERLLEEVALARQLGRHRNLLVSATGTGKTVMAAVDYARLRAFLPRARLLFVAHREEILLQSLATFRHALRDHAFGELWVGGRRPARFDHVFASIQSLHATGLADLAPDHFDVVVIDEFHHAAARTYKDLLDHIQPLELLALTATPERSDGLPLLHWMGGRIAAELRLWDAIDQHRLSPFDYFGIHDGLDLRDIPWRRGRGYDVAGLENLYTGNDAWARGVLAQLSRHAAPTMRALGFCVSIDHARFMARTFQAAGLAATAIWADTPAAERRAALTDLAAGRLRVLFSVDLLSEGIDVPVVDTLLLLRPTDSPTLFLQQLGRGLRKAPGKSTCTVLDFVGHHRKEFRLDRRLRALLGGTRQDLISSVEHDFPFLPAGCHMQLDPVARDIVLDSIRQAVPSRWSAKVEELRALGPDTTLATYLDESGLDLDDVYAGDRSWSDLRADAGLPVEPSGPHEPVLRRAIGRLLHIDDLERLDTFGRFLASPLPPDLASLSERDARLLRMLAFSLTDRVLPRKATLADAVTLLWQHPQIRAELLDLLPVLEGRIDHLHHPLTDRPDVPLQVHARYSRIEILAAFGLADAARGKAWQTGVYWAKPAGADLLAFTLDKTSGSFSPTTRYRDHAISRTLIHWESQSVTRADSSTGLRYQQHASLGSSIMLFARLRTSDRAFHFLGPATYVSHESETPMAITWRLAHPLPGDLFATFAAALA